MSGTEAVPPSVLAVRKAAALAVSVPGISLLVYQRDWPPLFVSEAASTAPPGEVWMTVCPTFFRDALSGSFTADPTPWIGPSLGRVDSAVQIDVMAEGPTEIDAAGIFTVPDGDRGSCIVGFAAASRHPLFDPSPQLVEKVQPCGRIVPLPPPDVVEMHVDLDVAVAGWRHLKNDVERAQLMQHVAFETLLAVTVDNMISAPNDPS